MIIRTDDGSQTLRHPILGELYHSDRGAVGESSYVYIANGLEYAIERLSAEQDCIRIFEVGFGSGLNALLTLERAAIEGQLKIDYHAVELYPLPEQTYRALSYTEHHPLFLKLHESCWNRTQRITDRFALSKYDIRLQDFEAQPEVFDLIYFDAFAPDCQPELWSQHIMRRMFEWLRPNGILVTYSAKGCVKEALRSAGFTVTRLPGALGKHHMVRAVKLKM